MKKQPVFFTGGEAILPKHDGLSLAIATYVDLAVESSGASGGSFYVRNVTTEVLVPYATIEIPPDFTRLCGDVRVGDQCCGRAVFVQEAVDCCEHAHRSAVREWRGCRCELSHSRRLLRSCA